VGDIPSLGKQLAERRVAQEMPATAVAEGLAQDAAKLSAWLDAYRAAYEALGYKVALRSDGDEKAEGRFELVLERSGFGGAAPSLSGESARQFAAFGLDAASGCLYRRYSELEVSSRELRGALLCYLESLSHDDWHKTRKAWARKQFERKWQSLVYDPGPQALEAYAVSRDGFLRPGAPVETVKTPEPVPLPEGGDPMFDTDESEGMKLELEDVVTRLCRGYGIPSENISAGICDLRTDRYALHLGDKMRYSGCVPKIIILLTAFEDEANGRLTIDDNLRLSMARMIRLSAMPDAGSLARRLGNHHINDTAASQKYRLYDPKWGGGLFTGRPFWGGGEGYRDPVAHLTHAVTARQALRYYWLLDHGRLVSPEASRRMLAVFLDTRVPILKNKFVEGLWDRHLTVVRKSGWYGAYTNDTAMVTGPDRHYIMACLVTCGSASAAEGYLESFAREIDDYFAGEGSIALERALGSTLGGLGAVAGEADAADEADDSGAPSYMDESGTDAAEPEEPAEAESGEGDATAGEAAPDEPTVDAAEPEGDTREVVPGDAEAPGDRAGDAANEAGSAAPAHAADSALPRYILRRDDAAGAPKPR
jgi:hypothetical protein